MAQQADTLDEEIDVVKILVTLWACRRWILACTLAVTVLGLLYAVLAKPLFRSEAIIALKEGETNLATSALAQFGGMGGVVATHLGMGSTGLDKIHLVLTSEGFAIDVLTVNDLLPELFPGKWDAARRAWKDPNPKKRPTIHAAVELLRAKIVNVAIDPKRRVITVRAETRDPRFAKKIVDVYLAELDRRIREDVVSDAEANQAYLERQLDHAADPVLREKVQNMIGAEIEKAMLVNSHAFDIVVKPLVPEIRVSPKRLKIVITAFIFGFFLSIGAIFIRNGYTAFRRRFAAGRGAAAG